MPAKIDQYTAVRLRAAVTEIWPDGSVTVPAGTEGIVVEVYGDGEAYGVDVELEAPRFAEDGSVLDTGWFEHVTIKAQDLEPLPA